MLRKRKRSKHRLPVVEVNVVSLMDVLTTLLFFLLVIASVSRLSVVPADALPSGETEDNEKKPTFAMQVIVLDSTKSFLYLGPVAKLQMVDKEGFRAYLKKRFKGNENSGYYRKIEAKSHRRLVRTIQSILIKIKKSFPHENKVVVAFTDKVNYQQMVHTLANIRELPKKRAKFQVTSLVGERIRTSVLFPQVTITEWQGSGGKG